MRYNVGRKFNKEMIMDNATGMAGFIEAATGANGINQTNLWGAITPAAGVVGIVVIFALSYRVLRKLVKGVSKGKANF